MFEAYKVGVTLALNNKVSAALGLIAREFVKTDLEAKSLQKTLKEIKLLGIGGAIIGGTGFMGLGAIGAAVKPANEYVHQLELAKAAGMSQLEIASATAAAWKTASDVMTSTPTENLKAIRELRMVFGDTAEAIHFLPQMQRIQAVLDSVLGGTGGVGAKDVAFAAAKALELRGASVNPQTFQEQADYMTRAVIASGGKVTPQMMLQMQKYAGIGGTGYSNDFLYGIAPTLVQELGGSQTGNSLTSMYRAIVGGRIDKKALAVWQSMGLLQSVQGVTGETAMVQAKNAGLFQDNPFQYMQFLQGELVKRGITDPKAQQQVYERLFSNRVAGRMANILAMQGPRLQKDFNLIGQAGTSAYYAELMKRDPNTVYRALDSQWESLKTALGMTVVPVIIPMLRGLTGALNSLAAFAANHPTLTQGLMLTFAGLSGLAAVGGTLMVAGAGLKLLNVGLVTFTGLNLATAATGLAAFVPQIAAIAAMGTAIANADTIGASKWNPLNLISDGTGAATRWVMGKTAPVYGPPMREDKQTIHTTVKIGDRVVAKAVNDVNDRDARRSGGSGGPPDYRAIPRHPGSGGGW
ncbi:hypothetical protein R5W24_000477 [Gemmata sp. JC717]|uniref:hypothetical protein n=1 Tax=Gemmata algarum TaxID=2975278 RepID=UPI0021BAF432|nr:hypothetical protein [Gemmata algarum]MDY3551401.1 hypothetical protein [Gemmata algarum]